MKVQHLAIVEGPMMNLSIKRPRSRIRFLIVLIASICGLFALVTLGGQIVSQHKALRSAPTDNIQWSLSQTQVELLMLNRAVNRMHLGKGSAVADVRKRFDIFFSRIKTLQTGQVYSTLVATSEVNSLLQNVRSDLDKLVDLIDGTDPELISALPILENTLDRMLLPVRQLSLDGIALFARSADQDREQFSKLLLQTGLLALLTIAALLGLLIFLTVQSRRARKQTREVAISNQRYASMVNSSLDAIVVSDAQGRIIDFNPAAESTFGFTRNAAVGQKMHDLIIPQVHREAHQAGMERFLKTGVPKVIGAGRVELDALHANGKTFPAELSIGTAASSDATIFIGYIRDISERLRIQAELTQARDTALAATKAKSEFLAVMSHEMRTPLNGVMGIMDLMAHTSLTSQQRHYLQTAVNSGEILQGHINDVLDITSIEAGALELHPTLFDLRRALDEVAKINEPAATLRGNQIDVTVSPEISKVAQDRGRLSQVIMNLVGNAVKFTSEGTIALTAKLATGMDDTLEISVEDSGVGLAPEDCKRIFEDFVMLDPSYQRTSPGTGLGLAISRRIVEAMNGEIGVTSQKGEGSRFWLHIPVITDQKVNFKPTTRKGGEINLPVGLDVLLVEDNETNRLIAREMLQRAGCTVTEAEDGVEGVEQAAKKCYDLIFMDISMPRMDGITATRNIRNGDGLSSETTIIGLTAHAMAKERKDLFEAGMQDCLVKPLRDRTLRLLLSQYMADDKPLKTSASIEVSAPNSALDPSIIDELVDVLPEAKLRDRLTSFKAELSELDTLILKPGDDLHAIAKLAHRNAGSAAVFGANRLREKLLDIEAAKNIDELPELFTATRAEASATRMAIEELIDALRIDDD